VRNIKEDVSIKSIFSDRFLNSKFATNQSFIYRGKVFFFWAKTARPVFTTNPFLRKLGMGPIS
jgi:hypothetical protein